MLVLSRKVNEAVIINDSIRIVVTKIRTKDGNHVSLGFDADPSVKIMREELLDRVQSAECRVQSDDDSRPHHHKIDA